MHDALASSRRNSSPRKRKLPELDPREFLSNDARNGYLLASLPQYRQKGFVATTRFVTRTHSGEAPQC
jgi:hypothetical protein